MEKKQTQNYRFYAFISYSRKNEDMAKWLQKKLESYRLPTVLQKQHTELPKKLKVFRDKTDIGVGGTVEHALSRELSDSKKLIVLCSPEAAKSDYVEYEIASFLKLGRSTDDILPFIVDGEIGEKSDKNCYTPLLMSLNLNAADAVHEKKNNAFIRLLASLLEIKYDDLKRREHVRTVRRNMLLSTAAMLAIAFLSTLVWYVTPHTKYYADYVMRWGVPEGIYPLSKKQAEKRPDFYIIKTRAFRPIELIHTDSLYMPFGGNSLEETASRPARATYQYKNTWLPTKNIKDWNLTSTVYTFCEVQNLNFRKYDVLLEFYELDSTDVMEVRYYYLSSNGKQKLEKPLSNNILSGENQFYTDASDLLYGFSGEDLDWEQSPESILCMNVSPIYRHKIEYYQDSGFERKTVFLNNNGLVVTDKNQIYGYIRNYDEKGRVIKEKYLYDACDFYQNTISSKVLSYKDDSLHSFAYYLEVQGGNHLTENDYRNFAVAYIDWSKDKALQKVSFFNSENIPAFESKTGASVIDVFYLDSIGEKGYSGYHEKSTTEEGERECKVRNWQSPVSKHISTTLEYAVNGKNVEKITIDYDGDYKAQNAKIDGVEGILKISFKYEENDFGITVTQENDFSFDSDRNYTISDSYDNFSRHIETINSYSDDSEISAKVEYSGSNRALCYYENGEYIDEPNYASRIECNLTIDGFVSNISFKNANLNIVDSEFFGYAEYSAKYSKNHKIYEEFRDKNGNLVVPNEDGYAVFRANAGEGTFIQECAYYLADGKTLWNKQYAVNRCSSKKISQTETEVTYFSDKDTVCSRYVYENNELKQYTIFRYYLPLGGIITEETFSSDGDYISYKNISVDKTFFLMKFENGEMVSYETYDSSGKIKESLPVGTIDMGDTPVLVLVDSINENSYFAQEGIENGDIIIKLSIFYSLIDNIINTAGLNFISIYNDMENAMDCIFYKKDKNEFIKTSMLDYNSSGIKISAILASEYTDNSEEFISHIKSAYEDWLKSQ